MSHLEFALGARTGFRDLADEDELAGQRVRHVLRITQDLRELFSGSSSILDIASGSGEAVFWYRSLFPGVRLVCLERPMPHHPTPARPTLAKFAGMAHYRRFDGVSIPYADASFDVVTGCGGLAGTSAEQRPAALAEAYRVLKPGGLIILFEPTGAGRSGRATARMVQTAGFLETTVRYHGPVPLVPLGPEFHVVAYRP
jgi:ubiquinone/menaquinone biosynthesis C-methylase UbiE